MLSVKGIYDGRELRLFEQVKIKSPRKVIVTFLDTESDELTSEELHFLVDKGGAFDFLHDEQENIYTDKDLKEKYTNKK
ncbi:MAG: hypothetical protein IIA88_01190 [Bacteroidetes bacterium]|nr:hypothetical protein [Bacteroidota bacterium]